MLQRELKILAAESNLLLCIEKFLCMSIAQIVSNFVYDCVLDSNIVQNGYKMVSKMFKIYPKMYPKSIQNVS